MIKKLIPRFIFKRLQPTYHYTLAILAALFNFFPARKIKIIGVTGTKGKSTTCDLVSAILEEAGYKTAISSTVHFKIGDKDERNKLKMTMPGRFFLQSFIRRAARAGCDYLILEMSSEGAKQFRHKFVYLDALIFTNLSPEHIESHGSYENYLAAKLKFAYTLESSPKKNKILVVNGDDPEAEKFLQISGVTKLRFHLKNAEPYELKDGGLSLTWKGEKIESKLRGLFNIYNILGAVTLADSLGVNPLLVAKALESFSGVAGRMEQIIADSPKQDFEVIVDYAHSTDSLQKVYEALGNKKKICVLGGCGGGRDKWKIPAMGKIAAENCYSVIVTTDDPYDDDPEELAKSMASGINIPHKIILDRREAIKEAILEAQTGDAVIITGKGSDPYMMGPNGTKIPWSDAEVAKEELQKVLDLA